MLKKDLHLAKNINELNKELDSSTISNLVKNKTVTQILTSAKKLLDAGNEKIREGDEENAYVLFGRYLNIIVQLQSRSDYQTQKIYILKCIGGSGNPRDIMLKLEKLKESLMKRYDELNESNRIVSPANKMPTPVPMEFEPINDIPKETKHSISCQELNILMERESNKFVIFDCRSEEDYEESKIKFQYMCNVPEKLCHIGMSEYKVREKLPNGSVVVWSMRKDRPFLIFVDWSSTEFSRNSPIWHLKQTLTEWDNEDHDGKIPEMLVLEGGYDRWILTYPMKCTNPHVKRPYENIQQTPSVDGIEYPNLDDIAMKDTSKKTPTVDRSTKSNAIKNYEPNLSAKELLEKKEHLLDKSLQAEKELLQLENEFSNKENIEDPEESQNVLFKILELQTKMKDNEIEKKTIDEVIKTAPIKPSEKSKVQDLEIAIKRKLDEENRLKQESLKKQQQRDEKLKKARLNKPDFHKTPFKTPGNNELILSPLNLNNQNRNREIPRFDRASKPVSASNQNFYDNQNFDPAHGRVERGLTGLRNLGNTCYMNSILQCLSHTAPLRQFILEGSYEKAINRTNNTKGHIIRTLAALIKILWRGDCKYISSKYLKSVVGEQENLFFGSEQQDAHEFLIMLIDWLQSDLQTIHMSMDTVGINASEKAWLEYTKAKESFILRLFYGQIKSTLKCKTCGEESATFDTFSNLSLELPPIDIDRDNLTQCFNSYFHGEIISGWNCPRCNAPRDAIKKLDISKLPPVLIIHLKRFYADPYENTYRKKTVYVDYPLTNLDMLPYVAPKERASIAANSRPYNLYAVSNHYGTLEGGHYTAFCLSTNQKKWYKFNDDLVTQVDRQDVKSSAAYVLFYTNLPDTHYIN